MILDKLHPFYFILAFATGLFFAYISQPTPEIVYKFPSPHNAGQVVYHDKNGQCYKYKYEEVKCPSNDNNVKPQPILEDFRQQQNLTLKKNA
jgi:hypothetical protein